MGEQQTLMVDFLVCCFGPPKKMAGRTTADRSKRQTNVLCVSQQLTINVLSDNLFINHIHLVHIYCFHLSVIGHY